MVLNIIDLNKLKSFQSVANTGSLIAASKQLHLTTSAIYQSIRKLEFDLNMHLFYRSGKKYILTADGKELLHIFQKFSRELEEFYHHKSLADQDMQGEIKLGLPPNYSKTIFSKFISIFSKEFPLIKFNLYIGETNYLIKLVEGFQIDAAIIDEITEVDSHKKISKEIIHDEELLLVSSKKFSGKSIKELQELPHLAYSIEQTLVQAWYQKQFLKKANLKKINIADNVETILSLIKQDMGLGIVPKSLVEEDLKKKKLIFYGNEKKKLYNTLYLIQNLDQVPSKMIKIFLKKLKTF